jgi:hypothetical protein
MTKRDETTKTARPTTASRTPDSTMDAVEQRVVAFAEQLGRVVGTVQAKAEGWLDRDALNAQVSHVRDSAAELLQHLGGSAATAATGNGTSAGEKTHSNSASAKSKAPASGAKTVTTAAASRANTGRSASASAGRPANTGRSGGAVDAPGKRHRKPTPNQSAPKPSDRIAQLKAANASRRRGRG